MDLNHDKQIQSLLCYRYTIGQGNNVKLEHFNTESRNCAWLRPAIRPPSPGLRRAGNPRSAIRN